MSPRIASLFSGTGALDIAVQTVFGGEVIWHCQYEPPDKNGREDKNQYAAKILTRHWPDTPNLGDITLVDWRRIRLLHGEINILTGGFPCTDVSTAGKRAGLTPDTRSGLWSHMARAIHELNPELVIIENVEGLLSSKADRGLGSDLEALDESAGAGGILRALGAVLGDLATLGFHAEWAIVAASEVGAPHRRKRVIIYAWRADADPANLRHQWSRNARRRGHGPADSCVDAADSSCAGREGASAQRGRPRGCDQPAPDADGRRCDRDTERDGGQDEPGLAAPQRLDAVGRGVQRAVAADADDLRQRADVLDLRPGQPDVDWGRFEPAIRRWERILGRPAPWPTDALGRLSPVFTEWMQGYPDGWVTCTPGLTRNAMLRALGNGVVPQQVVAALPMLHARAIEDAPAEAAA
ncbi:hypothetical protein GCM10010099_22630 [Streptomyces cinereus]|nr:hypothetical protein GCM10010099_22630 [Streptomyces cinereus]